MVWEPKLHELLLFYVKYIKCSAALCVGPIYICSCSFWYTRASFFVTTQNLCIDDLLKKFCILDDSQYVLVQFSNFYWYCDLKTCQSLCTITVFWIEAQGTLALSFQLIYSICIKEVLCRNSVTFIVVSVLM